MDPDLTIVLLGRTGVGQSASANTILGRAAFESKTSFKAVTTGISEETGRVFGKLWWTRREFKVGVSAEKALWGRPLVPQTSPVPAGAERRSVGFITEKL